MSKTILARLFVLIVTVVSPSPSFGHHLHNYGLSHGTIIVISQTVTHIQSRPPSAKKKLYVQPRWVESTEGVLVLLAGYWTAAETVPSKK